MKKKLIRKEIRGTLDKFTGSFKYAIKFETSDYWQSPLKSITQTSELTDTDVILLVLKGLVYNHTIGVKDLLKLAGTMIND